MRLPFRFRERQPIAWYHGDPSRSNQWCLYCGAFVGQNAPVPSNKEHLIGRNFVPSGSLDGDSFNFIFRACEPCNHEKARVEGHVSTVSLFNSPARGADPGVNSIARRKASRDFHPSKRGVLVKDASDHHEIVFESPGVSMKFGLSSPPQLQRHFVGLLAAMQIQGLFTLVTTTDPRVPEEVRLLPDDQIRFFGYFTFLDWGNPQIVEIQRRTASWPCYLNITAAEGYFRAILRRSRNDEEGWFWVLEWNRFVRVFGAINRPDRIPGIFADLPGLEWHPLPDGTGRFRKEVPLPDEQDTLFSTLVLGDETPAAD